MDRIAEIRERLSKITGEPWSCWADSADLLVIGNKDDMPEAAPFWFFRCRACVENDSKCHWPKTENTDFVTAAPSDIRYLLDRVAVLERALELACEDNYFESDEMKNKPDWYDEFIEEPIRPLVKLLRENGFNTECSCGHEMYVQCQYMLDGEIERLHNLLFNAGYRNYEIDIKIRVDDGHQYPTMDVRITGGA